MRGVVYSSGKARAALLAAALAVPAGVAYGQGCVVARSSSAMNGPENRGGYLDPGDWDVTIGYRHQFSYKHFVGDVEQTYRVQQGNQVENKINLASATMTYQFTDRVSVQLQIPVLFA